MNFLDYPNTNADIIYPCFEDGTPDLLDSRVISAFEYQGTMLLIEDIYGNLFKAVRFEAMDTPNFKAWLEVM